MHTISTSRLAILLSLRLSWFCWKVYLLGGGVFVPVFVMRSLKIWIAVFLYQNERGDKDFTPDLDLFTKKQIEITRRKKNRQKFCSRPNLDIFLFYFYFVKCVLISYTDRLNVSARLLWIGYLDYRYPFQSSISITTSKKVVCLQSVS